MHSWRRGKSGHMKSQNSIMPENYEEFISLTLRTRNSKKPSRMLARNWKHQLLPPCLARQARTISMWWLVVNPMRSNRNLRLFWKPVNPQDCVWEILYRIIMKNKLQENETIHCSKTIWNTNFFLCAKPGKFLQQRQQLTRNGKNWKRFRRGTWRNSEVRKKWSMKQGRRAQKFILPHWWTSVIKRMPNWRQSTKNTKVELYSEAILWKMILDFMQYSTNKDHQHHKWQQHKSWISYPDCQGAQDKQRMQYLLIPGKNGRCSKIIENSKIGMCRHFGFVYHDTNGQNHGPVLTTVLFLLSEICTVILWQDCYGKANVRKSYWSTVGRRFPIGNVFSYTVKKGYSYLCTWMTSNWLERNETLIRCGKYSTQKLIRENQHLSLDHENLGCT